MKKLILAVLAVFFMSGIASAATTVTVSGQFRLYPETNNYGRHAAGGLPPFITSAVKTVSAQNVFTDQRTRLYFAAKTDESVGFNLAFEIDSLWGQDAGLVGRNGGGAGQGGDAVNVEVKYANFWFKPMDALKVTAGIQTFADDTAGIVVGGGDMAGFRADYALSRTSSLTLGLFTWWQDTRTGQDVGNWKDSVYYIPLTVKQQLGSGTAAVFFYTIQDSTKVTDIAPPGPSLGFRPLALNYDKGEIYYGGLNYSGKAGNVSYFLMGVYNFGKFKEVVGIGDVKISAFAVTAKVDVKIGDGKLRVNGYYVTGGDSTDKTKYNGFVTGEQYGPTQTMAMLQDDLVLLTQNTDVLNNSAVMINNPNNNGDGVGVIYGAFDYNLSQKLNAKAVVGYGTADQQGSKWNNVTTGGVARKGKGIGTEYNAQLAYKFNDNLLIKGVGSYLTTGDYFNTATYTPDNVYRILAKFIYTF